MGERLTERNAHAKYGYKYLGGADNFGEGVKKLGRLEDIEEELGFELTKLFDAEHKDDDFIKVKENGTIYFCGDAYYGIYSLGGFLRLIKELLSAYKQAAKNAKEELR